jgi:hypothetical protein
VCSEVLRFESTYAVGELKPWLKLPAGPNKKYSHVFPTWFYQYQEVFTFSSQIGQLSNLRTSEQTQKISKTQNNHGVNITRMRLRA